MDSANLGLQDADLPPVFQQANAASISARARFFGWLAAELIFLSLGALAAILTAFHLPEISFTPITITLGSFTQSIQHVSVAVIASGVCFLFALIIRIIRYLNHYDARWYQARAAAESVKSIAWRYAVGGRPFPIQGDEAATEKLLDERVGDTFIDLGARLQRLEQRLPGDQNITPAMRKVRAASLAERQAIYNTDRIQNQATWYTGKARTLTARARFWHGLLIAIEIIGALGALALAIHLLPVSIQGVTGAIASGVISWAQTQRYTDIAAAYTVTRKELASISASVGKQTTEPQWATFVDEAEEACSREHRLWRATHDEEPVA